MDRLQFNIGHKKENEYDYHIVNILINDIDLIERLRVFEQPFGKKEGSDTLAGAYEGLLPSVLYEYLTSYKDNHPGEKVSILGCTCGFEACWPMKVKITEIDEKISWSEFEQPHRNEDSHHFWNYSSFGKFEFDKKQYQEQIAQLKHFL